MPQSLPTNVANDAPLEDRAAAFERRVIAERFVLKQALGRQQGAKTYLATDTQSGQDAVVKLIPQAALAPGALMRLEYEAALLSRVQSPWFAPVLHAGREDSYFSL